MPLSCPAAPASRGCPRGFTLLELAVTLIVVAVIAALAVPAALGVVTRTHDHKAALTIDSVLGHAMSNASLRDTGMFLPEDLLAPASDASSDTAAPRLVASTGPSEGYGQLSYQIAESGTRVGVAMRSDSGRCAFGTAAYPADRVMWSDASEDCSGAAALAAPPVSSADPDEDEPSDEEGDPDSAPPGAPEGELEETTPTVPTAATFSSVYAPAGVVSYQVSVDGTSWFDDGAETDAYAVTLDAADDGDPATTLVTATPGLLSVGTYTFRLRAVTLYGATETAVSFTSVCSAYDEQPSASPCAQPTGTAALLAGGLTMDNRTVVYGDVYVTGHLDMSHLTEIETSFDASAGASGQGDVFASSLTIPNGSNASVAGSVVLEGDFVNSSPQTEIGGSLTSSGGSLSTSRPIDVAGPVQVNAPNTVSGDFGSEGQVTDGAVPAPSRPQPLRIHDDHIAYDETFDSWGQFVDWWDEHRGALGASGAAKVHVDGGGTLPSGGTLVGDLLVVATGETTVGSLPTPSGGPRVLTVATRSDLVLSSVGETAVGLTAHLHADGGAAVEGLTSLTGSLTSTEMTVANHLELHGRLLSSYAGEVLWQQGFTSVG